jgi:hypothetical protein
MFIPPQKEYSIFYAISLTSKDSITIEAVGSAKVPVTVILLVVP